MTRRMSPRGGYFHPIGIAAIGPQSRHPVRRALPLNEPASIPNPAGGRRIGYPPDPRAAGLNGARSLERRHASQWAIGATGLATDRVKTLDSPSTCRRLDRRLSRASWASSSLRERPWTAAVPRGGPTIVAKPTWSGSHTSSGFDKIPTPRCTASCPPSSRPVRDPLQPVP